MTLKRLVSLLGTPLAGAGLAVSNVLHATPWGIAWFTLCCFVVVLVNWRPRYNQKALEATLRILYDRLGFTEGDDVRFCLWVPAKRDGLRQVTNYVPGKHGGANRTLSARVGVVGQAYRKGRTVVEILGREDFALASVFQSHHVEQWGYRPEEAQKLTQDRRAYLACPVRGAKGEIIAMLYCDTRNPEAFRSDDLTERVEQLTPFVSQILEFQEE